MNIQEECPRLFKKCNDLVERIRTRGLFQTGYHSASAGYQIKINDSEREEMIKEAVKYYGIKESYYNLKESKRKRLIKWFSQGLRDLKIPKNIIDISNIENFVRRSENYARDNALGRSSEFFESVIVDIPIRLISQKGISQKYVRDHIIGSAGGTTGGPGYDKYSLYPGYSCWGSNHYFLRRRAHIYYISSQRKLTLEGIKFLREMFETSAKNLPKYEEGYDKKGQHKLKEVPIEEVQEFLNELREIEKTIK